MKNSSLAINDLYDYIQVTFHTKDKYAIKPSLNRFVVYFL
jgi:hypothetical protein